MSAVFTQVLYGEGGETLAQVAHEKLWLPHSWDHSGFVWMGLSATLSISCLCLWQEVGLDDSKGTAKTILLILWYFIYPLFLQTAEHPSSSL